MSRVPSRNIRERHYRLLQVGKRELGMDDADYRELLRRNGAKEKNGKYSATTMAVGELMQAVAEMRQKGFKPKKGNTTWRDPRIKKITAIWIALADAGVVRDRSEAAMIKWCSRITNKARLEWAGSNELNACVEGLKEWARREEVTSVE